MLTYTFRLYIFELHCTIQGFCPLKGVKNPFQSLLVDAFCSVV